VEASVLSAKSDLVFLEDLSEAQSNAPATSIVLNGATIIQMLKPVAAKNFEYASQIFIPYIYTKSCRMRHA